MTPKINVLLVDDSRTVLGKPFDVERIESLIESVLRGCDQDAAESEMGSR